MTPPFDPAQEAALYRAHPERFPLGRPRNVPPRALDPERIRQSTWNANDEQYARNVECMLRTNARAFTEAGLEPPAYRVSWPRPDSTR